jgi:hypothetical protein
MHLLNPVVSAYPIAMQKVVSRGHVHTSCPPKNTVILDVSYIPGEKMGSCTATAATAACSGVVL